ncbi:DUF4232 domain-containing protein [Streptomyces bicolor]|uniref:DUF4232 domain-containing protein n=1 Tax=Streptomyces bicolor TaxID=66874 RepID=UPI0004E0D8EA|nr:DUF4232 domain-containing protein [Streptomyces bicolor]
MRATSRTVAALAAALVLTACGSGGDGDGDQDDNAGSTCADQLSVKFGPANAAPATGDTGNVPVTVTNRGGAECVLDGLPAVEFDAGNTVTSVGADEGAPATKRTLAKEATTSFTLTYVRGGGTKSLGVESVKIHLPGASEPRSFKWSYGDVALKSDGQTPDASVTGFQQSGD